MESKNYFANLKFARSRRKFGFVGKFDLGALFTKVKCTFLKSVWEDIFIYTLIDLL